MPPDRGLQTKGPRLPHLSKALHFLRQPLCGTQNENTQMQASHLPLFLPFAIPLSVPDALLTFPCIVTPPPGKPRRGGVFLSFSGMLLFICSAVGLFLLPPFAPDRFCNAAMLNRRLAPSFSRSVFENHSAGVFSKRLYALSPYLFCFSQPILRILASEEPSFYFMGLTLSRFVINAVPFFW
jgi:hypothetical protein